MDKNIPLSSYEEILEKSMNSISPSDFYKNYYKKKNIYFLIDLREKKYYDKYHIKGSVNIFWKDLFQKENIKRLSKNKKIFLISYDGHISAQVNLLLQLLDFDVCFIKFGYGITPTFQTPVAGWCNFNFPVIQSSSKK